MDAVYRNPSIGDLEGARGPGQQPLDARDFNIPTGNLVRAGANANSIRISSPGGRQYAPVVRFSPTPHLAVKLRNSILCRISPPP